MENAIRIGTRSSELALWQAKAVADQLEHLGHSTELVKIDSLGDANLNQPLYTLGTTGVFTKNLDVALLNDKIDVAVHSYKDVPTDMAEGIEIPAILKRGANHDVLVLKSDERFFEEKYGLIATGSQRRKAQWLHRYPHHEITDLRGNVNTRLRKLSDNDWNGAIFAAAGLKRIGLLPKNHIKLDWMIPAPAQGAVAVAALSNRTDLIEVLKELDDEETRLCVELERSFMKKLEGGCSAPIGALAMIIKDQLHFKGALFSLDGRRKLEYGKSVSMDRVHGLGEVAAEYILEKGGRSLMRSAEKPLKKAMLFSTRNLSIQQKDLLDKDLGVEMSDFITIRHNRLKAALKQKPMKRVIITSQNAVESIEQSFLQGELNIAEIYCVGRRTKKRIEKSLGPVSIVAANATKLAEKINVKFEKGEEFFFFCGDQRRDELPDLLKSKGHKLTEIIAYQTLLTPKKVETSPMGILFFSPSAVRSYLKENPVNQSVAICIGDTTADEARKEFTEVLVAERPSVESVLQKANDFFHAKQKEA